MNPNRLFLRLFILSSIATVSGALIKLNGNEKADIILGVGLGLCFVAIIGFVLVNYKRLFGHR